MDRVLDAAVAVDDTASGSRRPDLLEVRNLSVAFPTARGLGRAIEDVSFTLHEGKTLGIVGESGSGKSVTALAIMGLLPQGAEVHGQILFRGEDLLALRPKQRARYRGRKIAMVLQDPMSALDPVFTVRSQIFEPLRIHRGLRGKAAETEAMSLLDLLHVPAPARVLDAYPHELSGGMRQRVAGVIALACQPEILIADEPTTALDPTVQLAYLDVIEEAQLRLRFGTLFITHDFGVVAKICDEVVVMYSGHVLEKGPTATLLEAPEHPYTEGLLRSVPDVHDDVDELPAIPGSPPSIFNRPVGCPFAPRCSYVEARCTVAFPPVHVTPGGHESACWRHDGQ